MKRTVFILALLTCFLFATPLCAASPFTDVQSNDWFYAEVNAAYENGMIAGTTATTFSPNEEMTRGQFVAILGRIEGVDTTDYFGYENNFADLTQGYYDPYISWAYENGIVSGNSDTQFEPDEPITREAIAAILDRYINALFYQLPDAAKINDFADTASVSDWAKSGMEAMRKYGIIQGDENGKCTPLMTATRAEGAAMLVRFHKLITTATENGSMDNGYCRLVCATSPSWMYDSNESRIAHEKMMEKFAPYFAPHIQSGEKLAAVVQTKLNNDFLYIGITQKYFKNNGYKTGRILMLNSKLDFVRAIQNTKGEAIGSYASSYGINAVKVYNTPQGIFLYIVHSNHTENTVNDLILIGTEKTKFLCFPEKRMQCKKSPNSNSIQMRFLGGAWETMDFTKFPNVLGYTGK